MALESQQENGIASCYLNVVVHTGMSASTSSIPRGHIQLSSLYLSLVVMCMWIGKCPLLVATLSRDCTLVYKHVLCIYIRIRGRIVKFVQFSTQRTSRLLDMQDLLCIAAKKQQNQKIFHLTFIILKKKNYYSVAKILKVLLSKST